MESTLQQYIGKYPVILIAGPRQVGKTTLLSYLVNQGQEKINFVTLDDMLLRAQANEDPELFLRTHETPLIIDEFQYAPNLLSYIKMNVDSSRQNELFGNKKKTGTLYYLTGSQSFLTMDKASESLAGRVGIFDLFAFSTRELEGCREEAFLPDIGKLKNKKRVPSLSIHKLFERILLGSYPDVHTEVSIPAENYYSAYVRTYIERDIRQIIHIKDEYKFVKFISSVAARTAQEYNSSQIASEIGVDGKTIDDWISILKNTGIIYLLQPYQNNAVSRAIKRPKIYFMDTGLACYLAGYTNANVLENSIYSGAIFETYVISEIIKSYTNQGIDPTKYLYYYRDNNQKEIDLLIIDNHIIYPVEIKKSSKPGKDAIKNFDICSKFEFDIGTGTVLCLCHDITFVDENNYYVPIEYI